MFVETVAIEQGMATTERLLRMNSTLSRRDHRLLD